MNSTVKKIVKVSAEAYGWNYDYLGNERYEKDGYELYFFDRHDGFELTIRNPETRERETVIEVRGDDLCTTSPAYVALVEHVLRNAEKICSTKELSD